MTFVVRESSRLRAPAVDVWAHACTMDGVNRELAPWVRMTTPRSARGRTIDDVPLDRVAFTSVLLALGVLPFDLHRLRLVERVPGRGFLERSSSLLQRTWQHERTVEPDGTGCIVSDCVTVTPRLAPGAVVAPIVRAIFRSRHRVLRARFGAA